MTKTKHGYYHPTNLEHLKGVFKQFKGKRMLDLGSGTGEVVELALKEGVQAFGVEIEKELWEKAQCWRTTILGDMFDLDWSKYDVLYYYIDGCNEQRRILDKINKEFKGTVIFYTEPNVWICQRFK